MLTAAVCVVMVVSMTSPVTWAFSAGNIGGKCGASADMKPSHGYDEQATPFTYTLTVAGGATTYTPGSQLTLNLAGGSFKGFLVQVVDASGNLVSGLAPTDSDAQALTCVGAGVSTGLSHTTGSVKSSLAFTWTPPAGTNGQVDFQVTVVEEYVTYWIQQTALTLTEGGAVPPVSLPQTSTAVSPTDSPSLTTTSVSISSSTTTTSTTTETQLGGIQADAACGVSKGCFQDCTGGSCRYLVTWQDFGQNVAFEMYGMVKSADSYIALGFSSDRKMGSDSVIECVANNGGEVRVFNSYNNGYSNQRLTPSDYGISNFQGGISNGVLRCRFFRIKSANGTALENTMYDLNQDWHLMFATGPAMQGFLMMPHSTSDLPPVSSSRVDLQSSATAVGQRADTDPLVKAHGCVMIFAWVMFTSIGILAARYYKSAWSDKTFFGLKIWFQVHRACMVVALVLNSIGFILIFVAIKGYSTILGETYLKSHPVLGIIVTGLCLTNPIMAFFRPGGDSDKRWIFNWAHWGVGMTAYILSAVTICFGFKLPKARTPSYAIYIMIVYVIYVIIIDVIFELIECMNKKEKSAKVEGMEMTAKNGTDNGAVPNGNINTKDKMRKVDKMKTFFLALHIAFTGAFALVLTLVVALN
ncbi:putative ferric-chelate reductase 1 [Mya arenaria]|uniref:putative ferric-chelate reductase 1 n=1 Tax=Mya arenaria TaxID=6604 RepID=UPI0022E79EC9|nr:putative ferric-chelate reductase 1 [Mya arenaria]